MKATPAPKKATATKKGRTLSLPAEPFPVPEQEPPVAAHITVRTTPRHYAKMARTFAKKDPRRALERQDWQQFVRKHWAEIEEGWRAPNGRIEVIRAALEQGDPQPLFTSVKELGPRYLALILSDPAIVSIVESWWFAVLVHKHAPKAVPLQQLAKTLTVGIRGSDRKLTPEEQAAKKKERNQDDSQRRQQAIEEEVQRLHTVGFTRADLRTQSKTGTSVQKAAAKKLLQILKDVFQRK